MRNPYEVLGIPQNAGTDQLREAYRALAREYEGNARRMQEINDAYDAIVLSRGGGGGYTQSTYSASGNAPDLSDIRRQIQSGRFDDAITLLDGMPERQRGAEWYYLKGCAQRGRGWLEEAEANFARAAQYAPDNREYRAAYDQMRGDRNGAQRGRGEEEDEDPCCKLYTGLMCLDCLCSCCGGGHGRGC